MKDKRQLIYNQVKITAILGFKSLFLTYVALNVLTATM
ncbi:hypothetical protein PPAR_b0123 [Pseudoalteromonas paragorgicola KMM 3548]|nr:hypothetical protein PH505_ch00170 [Pseudoalteromonas distincta]MBE3674973.1 hypothetical protein [Pseudoalteromonas distincta KMM 3548]